MLNKDDHWIDHLLNSSQQTPQEMVSSSVGTKQFYLSISFCWKEKRK